MAIVSFTGFETGDFAEAIASAGTATVQGTNVHKGSYSLKIPTVGGTDYYSLAGYAADGVATNLALSSAYVQFYLKIETMPGSQEAIFSFENSSATIMGELQLDSAGILHMFDTSGNEVFATDPALSTGTQYRIRLYVDNSNSCATQLRVGDDAYGYNPGIKYDTTPIARFNFGTRVSRNSDTYTCYFDDITIDDSTWGPNTGEDYFCKRLAPNAAGSSAGWTSGTSSLFSATSEIPTDGDTTYIGNTGNSTTTFNVTNLAFGDPSTIAAIKSYGRNRNSGASSLLVDVRIKSGATSDGTTQVNPGASYVDRFKLYTTNPNTSTAWTSTTVNAVEVGAMNNNKLNGARCTTLCVLVLGSLTAAAVAPNSTPMLAATGVGGPASLTGA